jgi:ABC-type ATPase involved in cell division
MHVGDEECVQNSIRKARIEYLIGWSGVNRDIMLKLILKNKVQV